MPLNIESGRYPVSQVSQQAPPRGMGDFPPIHTIPLELVGEIFSKCLEDGLVPIYHSLPSPTMKSEVSPFTLSHVCSRWRNLALSTSTLWSSISLYEPRMTHIPLVNIWLQRAGDCPISIYFLQTGNRENLHHEATEHVFALFVRRMHRWKRVYFRLHTPQLALLDVPDGGARILESVAFVPCFWNPRGEDPYVDRVWDMFYSSPTLRQICWTNGYIPTQAPWTQLTHIQLHSLITDRAVLELLQRCPNIENVALTQLFLPSAISSSVEILPVTLPHLHTLSLFSDTDTGPMFQRLVLPALEFLDIRYIHYPGAPTPSASDLDDLLRRSSNPLKSLTFIDRYSEEFKVLDYLRLPSIQRIAELHVSANIGDSTVKLLAAKTNGRTPDILPHLKALYFRSSCTSDKTLSEMIASRLPHLQIFSTVSHTTCPHDMAFLGSLRDRGHKMYFSLFQVPVS